MVAALTAVGEAIRLARQASGLTVAEAAEATEGGRWGSLSRAAWGRLETGESVPDIVQLRVVSDVLGVSPAALGFGDAFGLSPEALLVDQFLKAGNDKALFALLATKLPKAPRE